MPPSVVVEVKCLPKRIRIILLAAMIALSLWLGFYIYSSVSDQNGLKAATLLHLESEGYDSERDIENIYIVNVGLNERTLAAVVTLKTEPMIDYLYMYRHGSKEIYEVEVVHKGIKQSP